MLELNNISITFYANSPDEKKALDHVSLSLNKGDFVTIIGSNGAGKSTLLNAISGNVPIDEGTIHLNQSNITSLAEYKRAKKIGRLFQDPLKGTAPNMSILENLGLAYSRGKKKPFSFGVNKKDEQFFKELVSTLGLNLESRLSSPVSTLSGGQRQALTLLMATVVTPELLLLDEHTAALDPKTASTILKITDSIVHTHHITTLMVTHNIKNALEYGNKTIVMNEGKIICLLEGEQRKNMSVEDVLKLYDQTTISDKMLF